MTTREWLRTYGYDDVLVLIDRVMANWKAAGVRTRRNWWEILAGGNGGRPRTLGGVTFPVLAAAQRIQGRPVTQNAIQRTLNEVAPQKAYHGSSLRRGKRLRRYPRH